MTYPFVTQSEKAISKDTHTASCNRTSDN